ncbi:MAG: septal ring lytic transglycosylase RlpA family protein [Pseudanabaena sp.]
MSSLSKLWAISLISLAPSIISPIFATDITDNKINYDLNQIPPEKSLTNNHSSNRTSNVTKPKYLIEFQAKTVSEWIIMVNRQPTFEVKDLPSAAISTAKLAVILNTLDFDPSQLQPLVVNGEYLGKYKNTILFRIPKSEVVNPSLSLTQWINNLRVAVGAEPMTLVEAQKQMYQLTVTNEKIDGIASWYGPYFQGRQTASGEQFEQQDFTAAHPNLPFDTYLKVTNRQNDRSVVVRINDRGPYIGDRSLDLSHAAAIALNSDEAGVVPITATVLAPLI